MMNKKCKNKKCQKSLPEGYKHKYCENCRNEQVKKIKNAGKIALTVVGIVGSAVITVVTKGKYNSKK